jgi:hypothetical protein
MTRVLSLLLVVPAVLVAAPVPQDVQDREQLVKLFGTPTDPAKRATFVLDGKRLRVGLAADKPHGSAHLPFQAPRVVKEVSGDFVAEVAISYTLPNPVPRRDSGAFVGGGIIVPVAESHSIVAGRDHGIGSDGPRFEPSWLSCFRMDIQRPAPPSMGAGYGAGGATGKAAHLRLSRKKDSFTGEYSLDGKKWERMKTYDEKLPEKIAVGLYAWHNTDKPCEVVFENFVIQAPPKD